MTAIDQFTGMYKQQKLTINEHYLPTLPPYSKSLESITVLNIETPLQSQVINALLVNTPYLEELAIELTLSEIDAVSIFTTMLDLDKLHTLRIRPPASWYQRKEPGSSFKLATSQIIPRLRFLILHVEHVKKAPSVSMQELGVSCMNLQKLHLLGNIDWQELLCEESRFKELLIQDRDIDSECLSKCLKRNSSLRTLKLTCRYSFYLCKIQNIEELEINPRHGDVELKEYCKRIAKTGKNLKKFTAFVSITDDISLMECLQQLATILSACNNLTEIIFKVNDSKSYTFQRPNNNTNFVSTQTNAID